MKQRYLIAILPPQELSIAIDQIRKECAQIFNVYKALRPPVHITLRYIRDMEEAYEQKLITSLSQARNFKPFMQQLENFSGFQNARAIYITATKNKQIENLYQQIKVITNPFCKEAAGGLTPHLTIAYRDVSPALYPKIISHYKNKTFKATFEVNHFTLLKHDGSCWKVLKQYVSRPGPEQLEIPL